MSPSDIKTCSSCIRSSSLLQQIMDAWRPVSLNETPRDGDIVLVRALSGDGAFSKVENPYGREIQLYKDDVFLGVLGTRKSGTNSTGIILNQPMKNGDELDLLSVGGLIGSSVFTPSYLGSKMLPVKIESFFLSNNDEILNLRDGPTISNHLDSIMISGVICFVAGTSAEAGKTTFVCNAIQSLKQLDPSIKVGAIKVCGTGRMRDLYRYRDAGASYTADFVDAGWPSTYNMLEEEFSMMLESLISVGVKDSDFLLVEIGGDLLEGRAKEALLMAAKLRSPLIYCCNDALGAMAGVKIFEEIGLISTYIASIRQNKHAMAARLNIETVVDASDLIDVGKTLQSLLAKDVLQA